MDKKLSSRRRWGLKKYDKKTSCIEITFNRSSLREGTDYLYTQYK